MLTEHWETCEADWQETYHLDLAEAVYGGEAMSARRVSALTLELPRASRTMRAISEDPSVAAWTPEMMLAGLVVERLDALHVTLIKANGGKAKKPETIVPRPKAKKRHLAAVPTLAVLDDLDKKLAAVVGGED